MRQLDGLSWTGSMLSTPLASDLGPGPERTAEERSAGRGVCSLRLSPPISSLARRRRRPGLALSWTESFAFYASRRRLRAWPAGGSGGARSLTGSLLSTPLAADFGPGPEAMAEERSAGRGVCFLRLSPPFLDLARRGRRTAAQLDGDLAFYGSCRRISAWPGGGGQMGSILSMPLAAGYGPGPEGSAEVAQVGAVGQGVCFLRFSPRVAQLDGEFALYASRSSHRAWPGAGGKGSAA